MKRTNLKFASEDILAIEELAEQLSSELDMNDVELEAEDEDIVPIDENSESGNVVESADCAELPDDAEIVSDDESEIDEIMAEAEELENRIQEAEEKEEVLAEAEELEQSLNECCADEETCPDCGSEPCKCASEEKPGIEDEIGDEANGGDPSVSEIVDNTVECDTDKEVFGQNTDSEYIARITARLDRVASALEKRGNKKMAFRIDQLSDRLEASIR